MPATPRILGLERRTAVLLGVLLAVFLIAGIGYTFTFGRHFAKPGGDGVAYERTAVQLLQTGVYGYKSTAPNAYQTPGYPLFLAALYNVSGHAWSGRPRTELCIIQLLIAASSLVGVFLIGRRLFSDRVGLVAALLFVLYPPMIIATNLWLTETLATALIVWFVYVALLAQDQDGWLLWAATGVLLGLAVLVRPGVLPIAIAPFVVRFFWGKRAGLLKAAAIAIVAFALVMAPWGIRNEITLHHLYLLSSHSGDPILAGVDPYYYELGPKYEFHGPSYEAWQATHSPLTKNDYANQVMLSDLKKNPVTYVWWLTVGKTVRMYSAPWLAETGPAGSWSTVVRLLVVVLGWLGAAWAVREKRLRTIAIAIALGSAAQLTVAPEPRYAFSWIALLTVPAAVVLLRVWGGADVAIGPVAREVEPEAPSGSGEEPPAVW
jgi:4-amino-4-deoxy-L-arabinose transferase-like glycosyltransferase